MMCLLSIYLVCNLAVSKRRVSLFCVTILSEVYIGFGSYLSESFIDRWHMMTLWLTFSYYMYILFHLGLWSHAGVDIVFALCCKNQPHSSYKLCLYMLEDMLVSMFKNINHSYIVQNHSCIMILKHFVYRWQMNITAEFYFPSLTYSWDVQFHNIDIETYLTVHKIFQAW